MTASSSAFTSLWHKSEAIIGTEVTEGEFYQHESMSGQVTTKEEVLRSIAFLSSLIKRRIGMERWKEIQALLFLVDRQ